MDISVRAVGQDAFTRPDLTGAIKKNLGNHRSLLTDRQTHTHCARKFGLPARRWCLCVIHSFTDSPVGRPRVRVMFCEPGGVCGVVGGTCASFLFFSFLFFFVCCACMVLLVVALVGWLVGWSEVSKELKVRQLVPWSTVHTVWGLAHMCVVGKCFCDYLRGRGVVCMVVIWRGKFGALWGERLRERL
ncbi:hypothetical protein L873DRAFT_347655 [Choiromyces venosus 120613-1]|uniref:Uncharacterized protein n=1 Tax=Choiromyces venosus 120613-1 TaxID=1336337 RepID=A0A3N4IY75_9PEZI|nr:hypothetical protein L873DRAFT_347655 [Choiromyces venosus 120613-1]